MSTTTPSDFRTEPWRILVFYFAAAVVFSFLLSRLFSMQVLQGENWSVRADYLRWGRRINCEDLFISHGNLLPVFTNNLSKMKQKMNFHFGIIFRFD